MAPTNSIVTSVVVPVVQALVGVTQATFESSLYVSQAFVSAVKSSLGSVQGASPTVSITGYTPIYTPRSLIAAPPSSVSMRDVLAPTGVKVSYNVLLVYTSVKSADSIVALTNSVNATLNAAVKSASGGASPFSTMLTMRFLNITNDAGYIETSPFYGITTPAPTVLAAVVTETVQTPVSVPTIAPVTAASTMTKSNSIIVGAVVGVGSFVLMATAVVVYMRSRRVDKRLCNRNNRYLWANPTAARPT